MQCLLILVSSLLACCSSQWPIASPTEQDVLDNIFCSVYEFKNREQQAAMIIPIFEKALLKNPNILSLELPKITSGKKSCETCMDDIGCFNCKAFGLDGLPFPASEMKTSFRFFTRFNDRGIKFPYNDISSVLEAVTKPMQLTFIVHGFHSSAKQSWVQLLKETLLDHEDGLVITVDWSNGASATQSYMQAVRNSQVVGRQVASILQRLVQETDGNVSPKRTHWIGHGLGAQMTIFFWDHYRLLSGNLVIGKITALDPAKAFFEDFNLHVNVTMARFVEVVHTSAGNINGLSFGMANPIGHVDFYINGGTAPQPGCDDFHAKSASCSHARATSYYIEALQKEGNCSMLSYACTGGLEQYGADKCEVDEDYWNAISLNETETFPGRGIQFVDTRDEPPFCKDLVETEPE